MSSPNISELERKKPFLWNMHFNPIINNPWTKPAEEKTVDAVDKVAKPDPFSQDSLEPYSNDDSDINSNTRSPLRPKLDQPLVDGDIDSTFFDHLDRIKKIDSDQLILQLIYVGLKKMRENGESQMQRAYENIFREQKIQKKLTQEQLALAEKLEKATQQSKVTSWINTSLQLTTTVLGIVTIGFATMGIGGVAATVGALAFSASSISSGITTAYEAKYQHQIGQFNMAATGIKADREGSQRNIQSSQEIAGSINNDLANTYKMQKQIQDAAAQAARM